MSARRVLICGGRDWRDLDMIREFVATLPPFTLVIEGGQEGADRKAKIAAHERGLPVAEVGAAWGFYGKPGGPIRNQWMLDYLAPTELHAFHDNLANSKGTRDMWNRARKLGIPCELHSHAKVSA